jgi:beta-glucosidase
MARASMVLLKNDGLLPIKGDPRTIAVIGPNADSMDTLVGNYYGTPSNPTTVLDGIRARYPNSKIVYAQGTGLVGPAELAVPDEALCADAACTTPGLKVEYFKGVELQGAPTESRVESNARIAWSGDKADSARWTGYIKAPETGEYRFRLQSENGYRVKIGDTMVVDEWGVGDSPSILSGSISLEAGKVYPITVEGFQRGVKSRQWLVWSPPSANGDDAVAAAKGADLVVFVGGLSARIEGEEMKLKTDGFAGGDRTSLDLPAPQEKLLERVVGTGKPTVLVLMNGSAMSVNWADRHVPAIVEAWYPGEAGGEAVASLLAGDFSPAGRLPVTFYKSVDQLPPFEDYSMAKRTYRYFDGPVLYPFGHGLSYTSFAYGQAKVSAGAKSVSVDVTNSGAMDGDEVVQLYVSHPGAADAPIRALAGFQRVHLRKGETKTVTFTLDDRRLSVVDAQGVRRVTPGKVEFWVGGGQPVAGVAGSRASFDVTKSAVLPR